MYEEINNTRHRVVESRPSVVNTKYMPWKQQKLRVTYHWIEAASIPKVLAMTIMFLAASATILELDMVWF